MADDGYFRIVGTQLMFDGVTERCVDVLRELLASKQHREMAPKIIAAELTIRGIINNNQNLLICSQVTFTDQQNQLLLIMGAKSDDEFRGLADVCKGCRNRPGCFPVLGQQLSQYLEWRAERQLAAAEGNQENGLPHPPLIQFVDEEIGQEALQIHAENPLPAQAIQIFSSADLTDWSSQPASGGHFSQIFTAKIATGEWVAVKQLRSDCPTDRRQKRYQQFAEEVAVLMDFDHRNIIIAYGRLDGENTALKLVLEYMPGGSFAEYLSRYRSQMSSKDLHNAALSLAKALKYTHRRRYIHRDVALRNLLCKGVPGRLQIKLSDFGLCKHLDDQNPVYSINQDLLRAELPWSHMPPEARNPGQFTYATDSWSYAVCLWEMFQLFHSSKTAEAVLQEVGAKQGCFEPHPFAHDSLKVVMTECFSENPSQRPNFEEIVQRVSALDPNAFSKTNITDPAYQGGN